MTWYPIAFTPPQYEASNGIPYSGAVLKAYRAQTTTVIPMATSYTGATTANSFTLNASGYPVSGGSVIIPHVEENCKLALYPTQAAADANSGAVWTYDDIQVSSGSNAARYVNYAEDTGAADAYVVAPDPGISAYTKGQVLTIIPDNANSGGSCTITVSGLSAKNIKLQNGKNPHANAMLAGGAYFLMDDGTNFLLMNPETPLLLALKDRPTIIPTLSNNISDATNDIDIAAGACVSDDGTTLMFYAGGTIETDNVFDDTGNKGLDTGVVGNNTYHIWMIHRPDTGVTKVVASLSASAPTLLAAYTKKKCIGSILRSGGTILPFFQDRNKFYLSTPLVTGTATNPGTSAVTTTTGVPLGVKFIGMFQICQFPSTTRMGIYASSLDSADVAPQDPSTSTLAAPGMGNDANGGGFWQFNYNEIRTNTSAQIRTRLAVSGAGDRVGILTLGWIDPRL